jgi:diadenosine tetraphosphatase ApaH/serine/threonine PP2A family protein phosphatase
VFGDVGEKRGAGRLVGPRHHDAGGTHVLRRLPLQFCERSCKPTHRGPQTQQMTRTEARAEEDIGAILRVLQAPGCGCRW